MQTFSADEALSLETMCSSIKAHIRQFQKSYTPKISSYGDYQITF